MISRGEVSIASFNVHAGIDGWGRRFDAVGACLGLDADVLAIPESWRGDDPTESIADRVAELGGYTVIDTPGGRARRRCVDGAIVTAASWGPRLVVLRPPAIQFESPRRRLQTSEAPIGATRGAWSLSLLTRLPIRYRELIPLPKLGHDAAHRHAILVELEVGAARLTVVAAHLGHLQHGSIRQMRTLARRMAEIEGACALIGDFNCWGPPLRVVFPRLRDALRGATWPAWRPHSRIDHILISSTLEVIDGGVGPDRGSDHRPVRCVLSIRETE